MQVQIKRKREFSDTNLNLGKTLPILPFRSAFGSMPMKTAIRTLLTTEVTDRTRKTRTSAGKQQHGKTLDVR